MDKRVKHPANWNGLHALHRIHTHYTQLIGNWNYFMVSAAASMVQNLEGKKINFSFSSHPIAASFIQQPEATTYQLE